MSYKYCFNVKKYELNGSAINYYQLMQQKKNVKDKDRM
jgi:hypothetical protein